MRCFIRQVGKNWHAAFDFAGVSYTHSLRTKDEKEAEVRLGPIRDTLYRLENGTLSVPSGADPKVFIISGGQLAGKLQHAPKLTIGQLAERYLESVQGIEDNTRLTLSIHLNHFKRVLGADTALDTVQLADVERYAKDRLKEKHKGKSIGSYTVRKELRTFRRVWVWAAERGQTSPPSWQGNSINLPKDKSRERFRSYIEITTILKRGGVSAEAEARLWETLYLDGGELQELLAHVRGHAQEPWVYPMVAFVALTGCRRSEMCRSRLDDWDLANQHVDIREKKRDTAKDFTLRTVDIHPELLKIMTGWLAVHPGGQNAISPGGEPLSVDTATYHFKQVLSGHEKWSKVRGFHTLRHSVASILASKGVDQRYIDKIIGHHTEAMRKRYQHLFPKGVAVAINSLLG